MAFGRRNNKGAAAQVPAETEDAQHASEASNQKKRKPATRLSSVVNESATGAAIDLLKQNSAFALPNENSWVGLLLSADDIGGLSQKQKGDATKGSIIELIAADKIQVIATRAMLDEEFLGIVPNPETLGRMDEYSLLTEAPYYWAVFRTEGDGQTLLADAIQGVPASYAQAVEVSRGEKSLGELLPEVWSWAGGAENSAPATEAHTEALQQIPEVPAAAELALVGASAGAIGVSTQSSEVDPLGDAYDSHDEVAVDYGALAADDATPFPDDTVLELDDAAFEAEFEGITQGFDDEEDELAPLWQSDDYLDSEDGDTATSADSPSAGYLQYIEENRDRVVDEQEVRDTIARRFLSNDLDLVVDLEEFDRTFGTQVAAVSIEIADDPSDWLGSQVAQISRQANAELARLHQANNDELREIFIQTMALHVEKTMTVVSPEAPGSQYFALMEGAKKDFEAQRAAAPQEVSAQRREITARFESAVESRAEQAAAHARAVYKDKHQPKLERDLAEVGLEVDRRHEEQYAHDRQTVLEMRRKDANVRMDIGTNRIFESLSERQAVQREDERMLLEHWNAELTRFIDENRKDDVARTATLAEQQARDNQVAALKSEHTARVRELRTEFAERERRLDVELIRNRQEALAQLNARQGEWQSSLELEKDRTRASSALADQLKTQLSALGSHYEEQYQGRISNLETDKDAIALGLDRANANQKRTNSIMALLVITLSLAALAVGVIIGWSMSSGQMASAGTSPAGFVALGSFIIEPAAWLGS